MKNQVNYIQIRRPNTTWMMCITGNRNVDQSLSFGIFAVYWILNNYVVGHPPLAIIALTLQGIATANFQFARFYVVPICNDFKVGPSNAVGF